MVSVCRGEAMLEQIHILLTYTCNYQCDHCFLACGPDAKGTFTRARIARVLDEAASLGTVDWIYFEGGEPFLYYPLLVEGIRMASAMGFKMGIVTNGYWATTEEDAELWLKPLRDLGISDLGISDDEFHGGESTDTPARRAIAAAKKLGLPVGRMSVEKPRAEKGAGTVKFRGRAAEKLTDGLPRHPAATFTECPFEDLRNPARVHVDPFGNVLFCQGLGIGSLFEEPLSRILADCQGNNHPILGPLIAGGPAFLGETHNADVGDDAVDACHLCYRVRKSLMDRFPRFLTPRQVYG
jgi:hypothetical protein